MNSRHFFFYLIIVGSFLLISGQNSWSGQNTEPIRNFEFPSDPYSFQPGEGQDIAQSYCLICHSADYIYMQPPHSEKKWTAIVHKMKKTFGCPIPDSQISTLVGYLVKQQEMDPRISLTEPVQEDSSLSIGEMGNPNKGKTVYTRYCLGCHGSTGKGDGPIGQSLVPPAANLTALGEKPDKELLQTIRKGRAGTAMPAWRSGLSEQDILDVLSYIRGFSPRNKNNTPRIPH